MKKTMLFIIAVLFIGLYVPLSRREMNLQKNSKGGVLTLQMAFSVQNGINIIDSWNEAQRVTAWEALIVDLFWIPTYVAFLALLGSFRKRSALIILPIIGGVLDVSENILHLIVLSQNRFNLIPAASVLAVTKYFCLSVDMALVLAFWMVDRRKKGEAGNA